MKKFDHQIIYGELRIPRFLKGKILQVGDDGLVDAADLPQLQHVIFTQSTPSSDWEFTHDFGVDPFVTVYDDSGNNITYAVNFFADHSVVTVTTDNSPITGTVELYAFGASSPVTVTPGGSELTWQIVNSATNALVNYGYFVTTSGVNVTLPTTATLGDRIVVAGEGLWQINQRSGQTIRVGERVTTQGATGYLASTKIGDSITLISEGGSSWFGIPSPNCILTGIGNESGVINAIASTTLLPDSLVYISVVNSQLTATPAIASISSNVLFLAQGYVRKAYSSGQIAAVFQAINSIIPITGLPLWTDYYLSSTDSGNPTTTSPAELGTFSQYIGKSIPEGILYNPGTPIVRI
jgi:hypothetical protein